MKHIITIKKYKIHIFIKGCQACGEPTTILMGKHAHKCLDCIKKERTRKELMRYLPKMMIPHTNESILLLIRSGEAKEEKVHRGCYGTRTVWEKIQKPKGELLIQEFD